MVDPIFLPSRSQRNRQKLHLVGRADRRHRPVRAGVFRDLAARGDADGPAAAAAAGAGLARARRCRNAGQPARRQQCRRLYRGVGDRLLRFAARRSGRGRFVFHDRKYAQHPRQPHLLRVRPARAEPVRRHRLLVIPGRAPSGLRGDPRRADRQRHRRRRQSAADALSVYRLLPGVDAVAAGPLLRLRRPRRRLCARRGRRGGDRQGAGRRACRQ